MRARLSRMWSSWRVEILLALLVIVVAGPVVHEYKAQQASRYVLTAAIWDDGTIKLDRYAAADPPVIGIDRAVRDGHTLSDKAPLQPMLAVPVYGAYRLVGGEPAIEARYDENLGLWWVTLWMATVPAAALAVMMYRLALRFDSSASKSAVLAVVFGTILLPFSMVLFGHMLAACFLFASLCLLLSDPVTSRRLLMAGLIAGAAVAVEYPAAIGVVVLTGLAVYRARGRVGWFVAGGIPAVLGLAWYHTVAFGSPLTHPYRFSAFTRVHEEARGFFDQFTSLQVENIFLLLFSGRGFLFATPIVLVGLVGLVMLARTDSQRRVVAVTSLAMVGGFLLIPLFWGTPWGGASPGPRYMLPAYPVLVTGVAIAWSRLGIWARAAAAFGAFVMVVASFTDPLIGSDAGLGSWIRLAADGDIVPTVFTIALGPLGWIVHLGLIVLVARAVLRGAEQSAPTVAEAA